MSNSSSRTNSLGVADKFLQFLSDDLQDEKHNNNPYDFAPANYLQVLSRASSNNSLNNIAGVLSRASSNNSLNNIAGVVDTNNLVYEPNSIFSIPNELEIPNLPSAVPSRANSLLFDDIKHDNVSVNMENPIQQAITLVSAQNGARKRIRHPIRTHRRPSNKNPVARKPIPMHNNNIPLITPRSAYLHSPRDWFAKGYVDIVTDAHGRRKVIATRNLLLANNEDENYYIGKYTGLLPSNLDIRGLSREQAVYIVTNRDTKENFDLATGWIGMMNHAPELSSENNTKAMPDGVIQTHDIGRGEELRFDYGIDYWVFQLTGLERKDFRTLEQQALLKEMHERVVDYDALIAMNLHHYIDDDVKFNRSNDDNDEENPVELAKRKIITAVKTYLNSFPRTIKFFIDNNSRPIHNKTRVREAIYIRSKIDGENELYDEDEEEEKKSDVYTTDVSCSPDLSHKLEVDTHVQWFYNTNTVDGDPISRSIRLVRLRDVTIKRDYFFVHASDLVGVIETMSNVSRTIAVYETPSEKLKLDIKNKKNHCIGKEANVLSLKGIQRYVREKLKYNSAAHYREFVVSEIIPFLQNPTWNNFERIPLIS